MRYEISGGAPLHGAVRVSSAKNSALKLMAASLLAESPSMISNMPDITDVKTMIGVLRGLGAKVEYKGSDTIIVDPSALSSWEAPENLVREMRASIQVLGPLLARLGRARVLQPGGCDIGPRPIDLHLKGFRALGANINDERGFICASATKLTGAEIHLDFPSVGATENIMMAACLAEGTTIIRNAAREPEIVDQQNFLNKMGAKVQGAGTDTIKIHGVKRLIGTEYQPIPDRIEAGTMVVAVAITGGDAWVENVIPEHVNAVTSKLREAGVEIIEEDSRMRVMARGPIKAISIRSLPYPGFPTDMQPQMSALLSFAQGTSIITENIFPNRFRYIEELRRMGADIKLEGRVAIIHGKSKLLGADVEAPDLRGGAALVLAGLAADGVTRVSNIWHIERGYERMAEKLASLGAKIVRVA
ncbi:MAG TPA: UDP-N-acetylglucosamine 1-carboxyvinyltransferase [Firmicutes bacterium]|nr:UDP-N-acetylglucosamine 1-carboxyvinyltransferase [Bacillota bacterium]